MAEYALHGPSNITDADEGIHWDLAETDVDQIDTWWSGNINMTDEIIPLGRMRWDDNFDNDTMLWLQKNPIITK